MPNISYAKEWIKFAERDYAIALHLSKTFHPLPTENICYSCQQSVEKSLKTILAYNEVDIPKIHDIIALDDLCQNHKGKTLLDAKIAGIITRFATKFRYLDNVFDLTKEDAELGLKYAKIVLDQVKEILSLPQNSETDNPNDKGDKNS